jgi:L-ribulose-5-phosphate 4-epimerase
VGWNFPEGRAVLDELRKLVCRANVEMAQRRLATATWGNVSAIDFASGTVAIKPSGVSADILRPRDIVLLRMDGSIVEGELKPSTDTPTHLELYRAWPGVGGIAHTHSTHGTMFAQAMRAIPCLGTTHADYFHGEIPITRELTAGEVAAEYERNTGLVILEAFKGLNPAEVPGVLVARHAPFAWGRDAEDAVRNAEMLELIARIAFGTLAMNPAIGKAPDYLADRHYMRKHGPGAYYGQREQ